MVGNELDEIHSFQKLWKVEKPSKRSNFSGNG
jgi:hypothetical protein